MSLGDAKWIPSDMVWMLGLGSGDAISEASTGCLKKNALFRKSLIVILPLHKKHNDCIFLLTKQVNNTKYIVIFSKENYFSLFPVLWQ